MMTLRTTRRITPQTAIDHNLFCEIESNSLGKRDELWEREKNWEEYKREGKRTSGRKVKGGGT